MADQRLADPLTVSGIGPGLRRWRRTRRWLMRFANGVSSGLGLGSGLAVSFYAAWRLWHG